MSKLKRTTVSILMAALVAGFLTMTTVPALAEEAVDNQARTEAAEAQSEAAQAKSKAAQAEQGVSNVSGGLVALEARVAALEGQNADLLARLAALEANTVLQLDGALYLDETSRLDCKVGAVAGDCPVAVFDAVNVQIVNGTDQTIPIATAGTDGPNGLGNLIIGYDEARTGGPSVCSDGQFGESGDCTVNADLSWARNHKTGTHNLIVGGNNSYSQAAGVVFGSFNAVNRNWSLVTGGQFNVASGLYASVSGGEQQHSQRRECQRQRGGLQQSQWRACQRQRG